MKTLRFTRYDHRKHLDDLFNIMISPEEQNMFLTHSVFNSLKDFDGWIQDRLKFFYHEFYVIESDEGEFIGFVYSYDQRLQDGHCKMAVYIAPAWRKGGVGAIAGLQLLDHLFRHYPLRRIYCDVYSYNTESLESLKQCGFEMTGRWKEYRYYDGAYHDLMLLSMTRDYFLNHWRKIFDSNAQEAKE